MSEFGAPGPPSLPGASTADLPSLLLLLLLLLLRFFSFGTSDIAKEKKHGGKELCGRDCRSWL
jgi:hypothetical protein